MRFALLATALAFGCAPGAPRSPSTPLPRPAAGPAPARGEAARASGERPARGPEASTVKLEPVPQEPLVPAAFSIAEPRQGAFVTSAEASSRSVSVQGARGELWIGLDEHPFRSVRTGSIRLGALLLEDEELAPGTHRIVVLQETDAGWAFAASSFSVVDESPASPPPVPAPSGVVFLDPHGTYNGAASADAVTVRAWSLATGASLLVRLSGAGFSLEKRANGEALRVVGLPSGDFRFEVLELRAPTADGRAVHGGGPWSTMSRVVTVNRDAPLPQAAAAPSAPAPAPGAPPVSAHSGKGGAP